MANDADAEGVTYSQGVTSSEGTCGGVTSGEQLKVIALQSLSQGVTSSDDVGELASEVVSKMEGHKSHKPQDISHKPQYSPSSVEHRATSTA